MTDRSEAVAALDGWGTDLDVLQWLVWYARKAKGTSREVAQRALNENPSLRFTERLAARRPEMEAGLDIDSLREAARRAGLPPDLTVADIENLAREYEKERLAQALRDGDTATFTVAVRRAIEGNPLADRPIAGRLDVERLVRAAQIVNDRERLLSIGWTIEKIAQALAAEYARLGSE